MDGLIETPAISSDQLVADAWAAMAQHNWAAALSRWALVRERDPGRCDAHVRSVQTLWLAGRLDEAEAMAVAVLTRLPENPDVLVQYAWLAMARQDWEEGVRRWARAREAAPDRPESDVGLIRSFRLTGRLDEAEAVATGALDRFLGHPELLVENVWLAVSREQWLEAAARARVARRRLAALGQDSIPLGAAEYRIAIHEEWGTASEMAAGNPPPQTAADEILTTAMLMLSFESLGERCDLGLAQRHYGVEPFGLLRLAYTSYDGLIAALEARFDGIGGAKTEFERRDGELIAKVDRYGLSFHTFTYENELTRSGKHERFYRRWLAHLRAKLIADLEMGEKIFVYGNAVRLLDDQIGKLFTLIRGYGPSALLCVRPADVTHPDGMVEVLEPGLYVAYLGRFAAFEAGEQPSFEAWRRICETTYRMSRQWASNGAGARLERQDKRTAVVPQPTAIFRSDETMAFKFPAAKT